MPENPGDVATFGADGVSSCTASAGIEIESIIFTPDAQAYSFTIDTGGFALRGPGIVNNSGVMQNFTVIPYGYPANLQDIVFLSESSAGDLIQLTSVGSIEGDVYGGAILFEERSNAGGALINNQQTQDSDYSGTNFYDSSSAQNAMIINQAAVYSAYDSGSTWFADKSNAGDAHITNQGATSGDGEGGMVYFDNSSGAGRATITCEASTGGPYYPAMVSFLRGSSGGRARIILYGDGTLYTYFRVPQQDPDVFTIGSLEGDGHAVISADSRPLILSIGGNNLSTTFDGLLEQVSREVSLRKIGSGRLILTNANTYQGDTTVNSGILLVNNAIGSGTGSGNVFVTGGTFGGGGTVAGRVIVGTGSSSGAFLAPGKTGVKPGTLTIQKRLILEADATYKVTLDSRIPAADKVASFGASIRRASILFNDIGASVIPVGTVFTVIDNTATIATVGTFDNLPDGSTITVGSNTFQANYEGGDGNDLTLTVVP